MLISKAFQAIVLRHEKLPKSESAVLLGDTVGYSVIWKH
jgi:hypothetical protein